VCAKSKGIWAPENEWDVIFIVQQAGSSSGGGDRDKQYNAHGDIQQISLALM
jgi:hypothetical protein